MAALSRFPRLPCYPWLLCLLLLCPALSAQQGAATLEPPELGSRSAVLMDAATGTLLFSKNPEMEIPPASLTKLMTIHVALTLSAQRGLSLDEPFSPPRQSWAINQPPHSSLMFLAAGQQVTLRELLLGLAVPSGNDAAVAVALRFFPTVAEFVEIMNQEAHRLGMTATIFTEPSGIAATNMTTAMEYANFCREYIALHPETLREYHSVWEFAYPKRENVAERYQNAPGTIVQHNINPLLRSFEGVDGLKTGYIEESGYNIALTGIQGETRLLAVILGAPSQPGGERIREEDGRKLLSWGFQHYHTLRVRTGPFPPAAIWKGQENQVPIIPAPALHRDARGEEPLTLAFTALRNRGDILWYRIELDEPLVAPLSVGSPVGTLAVYDSQGILQRIPLVCAADAPEGTLAKRLWHSAALIFWRLIRWVRGF